MTDEQRRISERNHYRAVKYFKSTGEWFPKCVLHHKNPEWKHSDIERYIQWNPEDLQVMTNAEHTSFHHKGKIVHEEARKNMSTAHVGKKKSDVSKAKLSKTMTGRKITWGDKISESKKGHTVPLDSRRKISETLKGNKNAVRKPVICLETGIIYDSISAAVRATSFVNIGDCCRGHLKTCGGYHWEYYHE